MIKTIIRSGHLKLKLEDCIIDKILNDPAFKEMEQDIIDGLKSGSLKFEAETTCSPGLGGKKPTGLKLRNADTRAVLKNELFWLLRNTTFKIKPTQNDDGTYSINYSIYDKFDLRPESGHSAEYNKKIRILEAVWHGLLGISDEAAHIGNWTNHFDSNWNFTGYTNNLVK